MKTIQIGRATLIYGDCMTYMASLPDKAFDLAIVDPPYGIGEANGNESRNRKATNRYAAKTWDKEPPSAAYFTELQRVSKNQIVWGANHFIDRIAKPSSCWIVWDKLNGGSDFADSELAWTSFNTAVRNFRFRWNGMIQGDMKNKEARIHPTQKPVKLYEWLLTNYAKPGQRILDTHLGSMSSVIAALNLGFEITGCELDADYFNDGVERVRKAQRPMTLFPAAVVKPIQAGIFE